MLSVPFFKQDTNYSCGPATILMIFQFYGKIFSEEKLIEKLNTRKETGTCHQAMIELAKDEGFYVYENNESSLDEIKSFINKKVPVIVHYTEPANDEGHYSVLIGIDKNKIILNDPWNGEKFKINIEEFEKRWKDDKRNSKKWLMVVSTADLSQGKQYLPK
jgi:predicted double-glycine peptidase